MVRVWLGQLKVCCRRSCRAVSPRLTTEIEYCCTVVHLNAKRERDLSSTVICGSECTLYEGRLHIYPTTRMYIYLKLSSNAHKKNSCSRTQECWELSYPPVIMCEKPAIGRGEGTTQDDTGKNHCRNAHTHVCICTHNKHIYTCIHTHTRTLRQALKLPRVGASLPPTSLMTRSSSSAL